MKPQLLVTLTSKTTKGEEEDQGLGTALGGKICKLALEGPKKTNNNNNNLVNRNPLNRGISKATRFHIWRIIKRKSCGIFHGIHGPKQLFAGFNLFLSK